VINTLQVGLVLYDMLESIRKEHYGRSKLDLLVCTEGRVYGEHRGSSLLLTCLPSATTPQPVTDKQRLGVGLSAPIRSLTHPCGSPLQTSSPRCCSRSGG
jgi:hypothetical protein